MDTSPINIHNVIAKHSHPSATLDQDIAAGTHHVSFVDQYDKTPYTVESSLLLSDQVLILPRPLDGILSCELRPMPGDFADMFSST